MDADRLVDIAVDELHNEVGLNELRYMDQAAKRCAAGAVRAMEGLSYNEAHAALLIALQAIKGAAALPRAEVGHAGSNDGATIRCRMLDSDADIVIRSGLKPASRIDTKVGDSGVAVSFPADMQGRALVLLETAAGFSSGWLVSNNALASIPRELLSQLADVRLPPAGS